MIAAMVPATVATATTLSMVLRPQSLPRLGTTLNRSENDPLGWAGNSRPRPVDMRTECVGRRRSGGRGRGDGVAQRLELADVVAGLAVLVDAVGVVVGAEVVEAGGGVGEQVPDDHQDRAGDGDQGFELADAPGQAAVALAEEGVGLGGRGGDLAEHTLGVGVALAGGAGAVLGAGLDGPWRQPGPRHQVPGVGNWPMSSPSSAMMTWAAGMAAISCWIRAVRRSIWAPRAS